jgi:adenine-specific DNA-methyltransferase
VTGAGAIETDLSSNEPELQYAGTRDLAYRRKRGQFFTPFNVARFMSQWLTEVTGESPRILDPCAGLGVFERAITAVDPLFATKAHFSLWEKDEGLVRDLCNICERLEIRRTVTADDFLREHAWSDSYDAIIANPPYYRHHFIENKAAIRDEISSMVGTTFSVQTNVYCWFLIKALSLLKSGGRLAFIIPTEFLNANYGVPVKQYLLEHECVRHIISVGYRSKAFDDALTTACVLLAEKSDGRGTSIRFHAADSADELDDLTTFLGKSTFKEYRTDDLDADRKWRSFFSGVRQTATEAARLLPFSAYGRFSRGIATGANEFFAIRPSTAADWKLPGKCLLPCVSKARHAPGRRFTAQDYEGLKRTDNPILLFDGQAAKGEAVSAYIESGCDAGYHERYLTRTRDPWYALEKRRPAPIWVGVFGRNGVRFVWNESDCLTLTCFHVFQPSDLGEKYLPILFLYLNSTLGRELLEPEKREYGDGLEKYEPNDINRSPAADFRLLGKRDVHRLGKLQTAFIAARKESGEDEAILADADRIFASVTQRG